MIEVDSQIMNVLHLQSLDPFIIASFLRGFKYHHFLITYQIYYSILL